MKLFQRRMKDDDDDKGPRQSSDQTGLAVSVVVVGFTAPLYALTFEPVHNGLNLQSPFLHHLQLFDYASACMLINSNELSRQAHVAM